jgi:hypothetical protein
MADSTIVTTQPAAKEKPDTPIDKAINQLSNSSDETYASQFIVTPQVATPPLTF